MVHSPNVSPLCARKVQRPNILIRNQQHVYTNRSLPPGRIRTWPLWPGASDARQLDQSAGVAMKRTTGTATGWNGDASSPAPMLVAYRWGGDAHTQKEHGAWWCNRHGEEGRAGSEDSPLPFADAGYCPPSYAQPPPPTFPARAFDQGRVTVSAHGRGRRCKVLAGRWVYAKWVLEGTRV